MRKPRLGNGMAWPTMRDVTKRRINTRTAGRGQSLLHASEPEAVLVLCNVSQRFRARQVVKRICASNRAIQRRQGKAAAAASNELQKSMFLQFSAALAAEKQASVSENMRFRVYGCFVTENTLRFTLFVTSRNGERDGCTARTACYTAYLWMYFCSR
jgi:hypothetical protein